MLLKMAQTSHYIDRRGAKKESTGLITLFYGRVTKRHLNLSTSTSLTIYGNLGHFYEMTNQ